MKFQSICLIIVTFILTNTLVAQEFNPGTNDSLTPYNNFAAPVAQPSPLDKSVDLPIANKEKKLPTKTIKGANSGIHFDENETGQTVRYDLYVTDTTVNYTGKERHGIAVNGQLNAPALSFTVGDTALVYVHNFSSEPTSFHWHGVQLPNRMDGVPFLTQQPLPSKETYIYKFPVVQSGTYWYHSHYMLQEQVGLFGPLIFNKRTEPDIPTIPVILSDWSDTHPKEIDRMLHTGNDWFGIQKNSMQSYWEALKKGKIGTKLVNEWKRMEAMDISDVYYEKFLTNGDTAQIFDQFKTGDKVRLRMVNGGSSSYFWLNYSGGQIEVVANDGNDVKPVNVDRLLIAPSETYDLVITIPENKSYEFRATAEDRSGYTSLWLGGGQEVPAENLEHLNYFKGMAGMNNMMKMNGAMKTMDMPMTLQKMDMNEAMYPEVDDSHEQDSHMDHDDNGNNDTADRHAMNHGAKEDQHMTHHGHDMERNEEKPKTLNYDMLQALENSELRQTDTDSTRTLEFELTGNMNRYVWSLNNKTVSESDKILIHQDENLRIILHNNTMMRHPMHLHGHDFRLLNRYKEKSPKKNVVDIMPMETDTLEFKASEAGDWFFHCHILYHMNAGMGRIFENNANTDNPEIPNPERANQLLNKGDQKFYLSAENDFSFNGNAGNFELNNTRWGIQGDWRLGYNDNDGYDVQAKAGRYFGKNQWFFPYTGFGWEYERHSTGDKSMFGQGFSKDRRPVMRFGFQYTLPWLIVADAGIDHNGHVLLEFRREDIPLSPRLRADFMVNTDKEYRIGGKYIVFKNFALSTHYDSDFGWGAGITVSY